MDERRPPDVITNQRKTIGVMINKTDQYFQDCIYRTVQTTARTLDMDVYFFTTVGHRESINDFDGKEKGLFRLAPVEKLDGLIVVLDSYQMVGFTETVMDMLHQRVKCPVVVIRECSPEYDSVFTDEETAIRPLLRHLMDDHGYRRICFEAGFKGHPGSEPRLQCYFDEMSRRGIPLPRNAVYYGTMWTHEADKAFEYFFANPDEPPEAIVCANDYMAIALIHELQSRGYRVPQDVVVTGFDNISETANTRPTVTTVQQDYIEMARQAVLQLDRRIRGNQGGGADMLPARIGLPGQALIRESCGCNTMAEMDMLRKNLAEITSKNKEINIREVSQVYFAIDMNTCDSYDDIHRIIMRKLEDIPTLQDFYCCLFEDENGELCEHITGRARIISAIRDRDDRDVQRGSFDTAQLLPASAERDEPQAFYVRLLHQRESIYGYTVMRFEDQATPSMFYLHWNVIVAGALRNLADQTKLRALYEERRRTSVTDVLTQLYNRRGMEEHLAPYWDDMCRQHRSVCFVMLDMDNLKPINDTFGHAAGDEALRTLRDVILTAGGKDTLAARMGGDEFLVFLPDCDQADADAFMERFHAAMAEANSQYPQARHIGCSWGVNVTTLEEGTTMEQCMHEADERMYVVKEEHRARRRALQAGGAVC